MAIPVQHQNLIFRELNPPPNDWLCHPWEVSFARDSFPMRPGWGACHRLILACLELTGGLCVLKHKYHPPFMTPPLPRPTFHPPRPTAPTGISGPPPLGIEVRNLPQFSAILLLYHLHHSLNQHQGQACILVNGRGCEHNGTLTAHADALKQSRNQRLAARDVDAAKTHVDGLALLQESSHVFGRREWLLREPEVAHRAGLLREIDGFWQERRAGTRRGQQLNQNCNKTGDNPRKSLKTQEQ